MRVYDYTQLLNFFIKNRWKIYIVKTKHRSNILQHEPYIMNPISLYQLGKQCSSGMTMNFQVKASYCGMYCVACIVHALLLGMHE